MLNATLFDCDTAEKPMPLPESRGVQLDELPTRSALTRQNSPPARGGAGQTRWFDWSANPYRGCEFGCGYCYARYSHEWLGHTRPQEFQERLYVKRGFAEALRKDLRTKVLPGEHVAFGTATDPYQPIERRENVMRRALAEFLPSAGLTISITTKSTLVTRDAALLARLARRNTVRVNFSITTPDARLARLLEPKAPAPAARFRALAKLRREGVSAGVFLMPVLPGVTDCDADLTRLFELSRESRAQYVKHQVVFLREPTRSHFVRGLRRQYPRVAARYEVWTRTDARLPSRIRADVAARLRSLEARHGFTERDGTYEDPVVERSGQRRFAFGAC